MEFSGLYNLTTPPPIIAVFRASKARIAGEPKKIIAMILNSYIIPSVENKQTWARLMPQFMHL